MSDRPTVVLLHALGSSAASWNLVTAQLAGIDCLAIDLPGFSEAAGDPRVTIEETVRVIEAAIRTRSPSRWVVVGHSMGGKFATILAARAERGIGPPGLVGVGLLAGSPPSPEPIDEERRTQMLGWVAGGSITQAQARTFVDDNSASDLPPPIRAAAIESVCRTAPDAWHAWLSRGIFEDWSREVGTLAVPACIVAGGEDGDLGEETQRRLNLPHYGNAVFHLVDGAAHLLPLEAPDRVADLIRDQLRYADPPDVPGPFAMLLASDRVSAKTRAILLDRARSDHADYHPVTLDKIQLDTLRAFVGRIIPDTAIDLAARIDAQLGTGDGWRFAELPDDTAAYRRGLDTLAAMGFARLSETEQDALLRRIDDGTIEGDLPEGSALRAAQLGLWFQDVRADAVRSWMAHPGTMARIGYDGIANGGDGIRKQGFQRTAADMREAWEPRA